MAEFTDEIKRACVVAFAQFRTSAEVVAMVREQFDVETDLQQVRHYNPSHAQYRAGERWLELYETKRKDYIENVSAIPAANQGYRVNQLQKMAEEAMRQKNMVLAASLFEQIAKEVGGVLTNERNVKLESTKGSFRDLTPEERRGMVQDMFGAMMEKQATAPGSDAAQ